MFTWEAAFFNGVIGSAAVAAVGSFLGMESFWILVGVAMIGSLASVGFRWMYGFLKDWKQRCMAFVSGSIMAICTIPYLASKGLEGLEASIFILAISLLGARLVKYLSTDFDVTVIGQALKNFFSKTKG